MADGPKELILKTKIQVLDAFRKKFTNKKCLGKIRSKLFIFSCFQQKRPSQCACFCFYVLCLTLFYLKFVILVMVLKQLGLGRQTVLKKSQNIPDSKIHTLTLC
jgi:hypothetical protein